MIVLCVRVALREVDLVFIAANGSSPIPNPRITGTTVPSLPSPSLPFHLPHPIPSHHTPRTLTASLFLPAVRSCARRVLPSLLSSSTLPSLSPPHPPSPFRVRRDNPRFSALRVLQALIDNFREWPGGQRRDCRQGQKKSRAGETARAIQRKEDCPRPHARGDSSPRGECIHPFLSACCRLIT